MTKTLDEWGRDKARKRYQEGGGVPLPRPRPDIEEHARQRLGIKLREHGPFYRGDVPNPTWRDPVAHHPRAIPQKWEGPYDSTKDNIKTGGRVK